MIEIADKKEKKTQLSNDLSAYKTNEKSDKQTLENEKETLRSCLAFFSNSFLVVGLTEAKGELGRIRALVGQLPPTSNRPAIFLTTSLIKVSNLII